MILYKRIIPFGIAILNLVALEIIIQQPSLIVVLFLILFILPVLSVFYLTNKKMEFKDSYRFILTVALIIISEIGSLLFVDNIILSLKYIIVWIINSQH